MRRRKGRSGRKAAVGGAAPPLSPRAVAAAASDALVEALRGL
eukprot:gene50539-41989_t